MRAFIYVSASSSLGWIWPANQVNHSVESNNECGMLLNKLTNPLDSLPVSKSKALYSLDSNSEQKMRLSSSMLRTNASPRKENKTATAGTRSKKKQQQQQISNFVHEVRKELIISLGWEEDVADGAEPVFNPFLFLSNLTQLLEPLMLRSAGWAYVTAGRSAVKNGGINPFYTFPHFTLGGIFFLYSHGVSHITTVPFNSFGYKERHLRAKKEKPSL